MNLDISKLEQRCWGWSVGQAYRSGDSFYAAYVHYAEDICTQFISRESAQAALMGAYDKAIQVLEQSYFGASKVLQEA